MTSPAEKLLARDVNDFQADSDWLTLIEVATSHAYFLLTDTNIGASEGDEP